MSNFLTSLWKSQRKEEVDDTFVLVPEKETMSQEEIPPIFRMPKCGDHDLFEITVDELQHLFSIGDLTSVDYVKFCLQRIQKVGRPLQKRKL